MLKCITLQLQLNGYASLRRGHQKLPVIHLSQPTSGFQCDYEFEYDLEYEYELEYESDYEF